METVGTAHSKELNTLQYAIFREGLIFQTEKQLKNRVLLKHHQPIKNKKWVGNKTIILSISLLLSRKQILD